MSFKESCIHFNGIQNKVCRAGIDMRALVGGDDFGWATRMPCVQDDRNTVTCAQCHYPTPEEVQTHEQEMAAHMERRRAEMGIVSAAHKEGRSTVYVCLLCDRSAPAVEDTPANIFMHIMAKHDIPEEDIRAATGRMAAHLDATDWFQNDDKFSLTDGRDVLLRSIRTPRRGSDKAMWKSSTGRKKR